MWDSLRTLLLAASLSASALVGSIGAQVVAVDPIDFGAFTEIEDFEGIVVPGAGSLLLAVGDVLSSGVIVTETVGFVEVIDFTSCGCGFFLSQAGSIDSGTALPSSTSALAVCGPAALEVVAFELPMPASRVGVYFEAAICAVPACPIDATGEVTVEAFDAGGISLGSLTVTADGALDLALDSWIGVATPDGVASIASVRLTGDCFILDDLHLDPESAIVEPFFVRGDSNDDGGFDISDAVFSLSALFVPGAPQPGCADAADSNDDGGFDISDAVGILSALFVVGAPPPPAPHPACGPDPTADAIDCAAFAACP